MIYMEASEKNFKICEQIIRLLHEEEITVGESRAILDKVKDKILRDSKVGEVVKFDREVL